MSLVKTLQDTWFQCWNRARSLLQSLFLGVINTKIHIFVVSRPNRRNAHGSSVYPFDVERNIIGLFLSDYPGSTLLLRLVFPKAGIF
jgi:hypothetical protein